MIGKRLNDRYKILKLIGGGGMADVYLAHDIILDRDVAVKVLKDQFSQDHDFIRRFRREAESASSLAHPNVVNIYDVGEEDRLYYIVMEYVEGPTLKQYIQEQDGLKVDIAVSIMASLSSAIAHAHENRIIHRDIKPHNILIGPDGTPKITDFGIARAISEATITHTNSILGSVHYLSPEQARGGHVTYKSDIYSLGIVLYEMLAGEVPFNGDTAVSIAIKHLQAPLPSIRENKPHIPQSVENAIIKATAKDPFYRYATALDMSEDLSTVLSPSRVNESKYLVDQLSDGHTQAVPVVSEEKEEPEEETMIAGTPLVNAKASNDAAPPKKAGWKKWLTASIIVLALLFGSIYIAFTWLPQWLHVDEVLIPDNLVGMEYEEASQELTDLALRVEIEEFNDEEAPEGTVISHTPREGTTVKVDTLVTLRVSLGAEQVPMEDVTGMSLQEAENALAEFDSIEVQTRVDDSVDDETVLEQSPDPLDPVIPGETTVRLIVSEQPAMTMRNLRGLTRQDVLGYIAEESLLRGDFEEEYSDNVQEGTVISQEPDWGTEVDEITTVRVVFSLGPEPEPETEPEAASETELDSAEEEEDSPPAVANVPFTVNVPEDNNGQVHHIRIAVADSTTDDPVVVVDKEISDSEVFEIAMTLEDENDIGYIYLYQDDEENAESPFEFTYDYVKSKEENNG
ncbi:Stk1 family PASTA domain-containing Ser/Thr kinase [Bacillus sp. H-16]|uniref:Stk1 family PASTA domain-containing Ser/Thr kinase n=1 Tax=Alteribacter salitolerans TaxID=2912333 RepID=UPI0019631D5A|nr:Stk1 family PASTA domain-containing Ser/Thr kinase [Alteribacter salitolerans]MBM7094123.1 Stk1 family PASTA domain-containing Ser/Thr kinase [Alteribacter salitolerans]